MWFKNLTYSSTFVICAFFVLSCKKGEITYDFEGRIIETVNSGSLEGATVEITQVLFSSSVANYTYQFAGSATTDGGGDWAISFKRKKATNFRIKIKKDGYFNQTIDFTSANVTVQDPNVYDVDMDAESWIRFNIINLGPVPEDYMTMVLVNFREGCDGCGTNGNHSFLEAIDTTLIFKTTAGRYTRFQFNDNSVPSLVDDSLLTIPWDTVTYNFNY